MFTVAKKSPNDLQITKFKERTILRLPPPQLAFGFEGGDDVLYAMAVGILVGIVGASRVTSEALLLILNFEKR